MLCPECREEMLILELNDVEIDFCSECSGIWLDEGELELLLQNSDSESPLMRVLSEKSEKGGAGAGTRKCPVCSKRMHPVDISLGDDKTETSVEIDKCPRQHGLWFDKGELEQIISASKGEPVVDFLSGMFG